MNEKVFEEPMNLIEPERYANIPIADIWMDSDAVGLRREIRDQWPQLAIVLDNHCKRYQAIKDAVAMKRKLS